MEKVMQFKDRFSQVFSKFESGLNGESKLPVHQLRKDALQSFHEASFPTVKDEDWKYTNVSVLADLNFELASSADEALLMPILEKSKYSDENFCHLVFFNGIFQEHLSDIIDKPGVFAGNLKTGLKKYPEVIEKYLGKYATHKDGIFTALNTALMSDGAFIYLQDGKVIEKNIQVIYVNGDKAPVSINPRNLYILGKNAQVKVVEAYEGVEGAVYFTNKVTESIVDANGYFEHILIQDESTSAYHISTTEVDIERQSVLKNYNICFGSAIARNDINGRFNDQYGELTFNGLFIGHGKQLIDNHTLIDHAMPNCQSHELYKGVLSDMSRGVFNGKIYVRQDAQKTNAFQENKTILLSSDAHIDAKPQLEIFADDVKCTHGATIGQLEESQLYYLRSRGIGPELARTMLINAFADDAVQNITIDEVRESVEALIAEKLA